MTAFWKVLMEHPIKSLLVIAFTSEGVAKIIRAAKGTDVELLEVWGNSKEKVAKRIKRNIKNISKKRK